MWIFNVFVWNIRFTKGLNKYDMRTPSFSFSYNSHSFVINMKWSTKVLREKCVKIGFYLVEIQSQILNLIAIFITPVKRETKTLSLLRHVTKKDQKGTSCFLSVNFKACISVSGCITNLFLDKHCCHNFIFIYSGLSSVKFHTWMMLKIPGYLFVILMSGKKSFF